MGTPEDFSLNAYLRESKETISETLDDRAFVDSLIASIRICSEALLAGKKVLIAGNGGSAADAQHLAGEFVSRFIFDRPPLPAIALTVYTSVLTAIGNDYGFDQVFSRQVLAHGQNGDVLIALSTSGGSPNILAAMMAARSAGMKIIAMTGARGAEMARQADMAIVAKTRFTPYVQQIHIIAGHAICAGVEAALFAEFDPRSQAVESVKASG